MHAIIDNILIKILISLYEMMIIIYIIQMSEFGLCCGYIYIYILFLF